MARNNRGGVINSRSRIENQKSTKPLQHEEILAGIGYDTGQGGIKKRFRPDGTQNNSNEDNNDYETDTDIEEEE